MAGVAFPMNQPDFPWRRGHGFHPIDKMGYGLWGSGIWVLGFTMKDMKGLKVKG